MDDEQLKLECLRLCNGDVKQAQERFDWIKGRNQGQGLKAETPPKANVVGRDGEFEKPFKDYLGKPDSN
jgi:hypothetical protein